MIYKSLILTSIKVLIRAPESNASFLGFVSAFSILRYFVSSTPTGVQQNSNGSSSSPNDDDGLPLSPIPPSWHSYLSTPLYSLSDLPSLSLRSHVAHVPASDNVLKAMVTFCTEGVRSLAVVAESDPSPASEPRPLTLSSTISVTDIGRVRSIILLPS